MSLKKSYLLAFAALIFQSAFSQKRDYVWVFNDSTGINFSNINNPVSISTGMRGLGIENSASISDNNGSLLFYINDDDGYTYYSNIYNWNHQLMDNGDSIASGRSATQGTLIIPSLADSNQYYVFYINTAPPLLSSFYYGFYYAVVDMSLNNSLGKVILKNNMLLIDTITEKLTAIKHGNGRDWWILIHEYNSSKFYKYLLTPFGIDTMPSQNIGTHYLNGLGVAGQMMFSKTGSRLCSVGADFNNGFIDLFDFDRCTGNLSNFINLYHGSQEYYGCAFSADGTKLYASQTYTPNYRDTLFQFDLNAANIPASKTPIFVSHHNYGIGTLMRGPDDKIYVPTAYYFNPSSIYSVYNKSLTVINNPDGIGTACNITPYSFFLGGKRVLFGLPNMINYNLDRIEGSPCDTILAVKAAPGFQRHFTISPNPAKDFIVLDYKLNANESVLFSLYNALGGNLRTEILFDSSNSKTIYLKNLPDGIYFWKVKLKDQTIKNGKLVILK